MLKNFVIVLSILIILSLSLILIAYKNSRNDYNIQQIKDFPIKYESILPQKILIEDKRRKIADNLLEKFDEYSDYLNKHLIDIKGGYEGNFEQDVLDYRYYITKLLDVYFGLTYAYNDVLTDEELVRVKGAEDCDEFINTQVLFGYTPNGLHITILLPATITPGTIFTDSINRIRNDPNEVNTLLGYGDKSGVYYWDVLVEDLLGEKKTYTFKIISPIEGVTITSEDNIINDRVWTLFTVNNPKLHSLFGMIIEVEVDGESVLLR